MTQQLKKFLIVFLIIVLISVGVFFAARWISVKKEKVKIGLAEPNFPYRDYTEEELRKMYPQIKYTDALTRVIPEETYIKFRQALKENNLEMAIEQFSKSSDKRYKEYVDTLTKFYKENKFEELYKNYYPEKIVKVNMYESIAQYEYNYYSPDYKQELIGSLGFTKDANGDWRLDSL